MPGKRKIFSASKKETNILLDKIIMNLQSEAFSLSFFYIVYYQPMEKYIFLKENSPRGVLEKKARCFCFTE